MTDQSLQRKKRLAAALRENLKRRKAQQRVRASGPAPSDRGLNEIPASDPAPSHGQAHDVDQVPAASPADGP